MNLNGKTCLLTGASGGIGAAIATALDKAGARLILVGRNQSNLNVLMENLSGKHHTAIAADLGTDQGIDQIHQACTDGIDYLINNAGVNYFGLLPEQSAQQLRQMLEINVLAPMLLIQSLLPTLTTNAATIVNIGSGFGSIGFAGYCGYSASKFALRGFTESLRRELADTK
ncbi:SDR family NAD(P)-dependent oxidoreductase [Oceanicoccus sp. KOV_DT_Chl]|uniref:SDR family NAD(P)-dependent oxidoreductase n=1 Tax=Oceanicoccus sp. KOV_DT_Chl TaxID=1904639 RepID=UPI00190E6986|nr:SDR family NAD(P)-dependent oxidoreductase [Oceanicoccus sp. KOV_DT_Chl]